MHSNVCNGPALQGCDCLWNLNVKFLAYGDKYFVVIILDAKILVILICVVRLVLLWWR